MLGTLILVSVLVAVVAWNIAVIAAFRIIKLAPAGQRLDAWFALGWWRFAKVRELAGDTAIPHIKRYIQAFLAFFAAIIAAMVIAVVSAAITTSDAAAIVDQSHLPMSFEIPDSSSLES